MSANQKQAPAPKRMGRSLRRLLLRRTKTIGVEVAKRLDLDGYVAVDEVVVGPEGFGKVAVAKLTLRGFLAALLCLGGLSPYREGRRQPDPDHMPPEERMARARINAKYRRLCAEAK